MNNKNPKPSRPEDFCSTREAASLLGVSIKTIQLWSESGILTAWKTPGGHRRILKQSVEQLLRQRDQAASQAGMPGNARRFTALVVDDESATRRLYELVIAGWGLPIRVVTAQNGFEGLIRIGEEKPDLLLTDLQMPGMDGFRMITSLREHPDTRLLHVIVASGLTEPEIRDRGGLPADVHFFSKPVAFDNLRLLVQKLLTGN